MNLSNIVIVLDHPDESRNIGAACRAMANNDISDLRIVGNKEDYEACMPVFQAMGTNINYQGAAGFKIWTGQEMPVEQIRKLYF